MATLREVKTRIGSVNSTLKITSAMKLVASAKLRHAQAAIEHMLPYQRRLGGMLTDLLTDYAAKADAGRVPGGNVLESPFSVPRAEVHRAAVVLFASNSALCGAFNANAVRKAIETVRSYEAQGVPVTVYSIGRKAADAMRRIGLPSPYDYTRLSEKPNYAGAAAVAEALMTEYAEDRIGRVELIYNHFVSSAVQKTVREVFLPFSAEALSAEGADPAAAREAAKGNFLVEPSTEEEIRLLLPKVVKLKLFTVLLDSAAAEHAARTVAMQTATDNGNALLRDLTLEYNKSRQQKITSEILDIVGGSMQ